VNEGEYIMIALLIVCFLVLIVIRVPVAFALLLSSVISIIAAGIPLNVVMQKLFEGLNSFPILAIPFFYLVGNICNSGGITQRLMRLSYALVGHLRGALAQVNVLVSMLFAGLSGSSTADTAGIGGILIPAMIKEGYSREFTVAITAISSTMGVIIPPSVLMVVYGSMGNVSIGAMFLGGALPGILIGLGQMFLCWLFAKKYNYPIYKKTSIKEKTSSLFHALPALLIPIIIMGGVLGGVFTATESAVIAAVYALVLGVFIYKDIKPNEVLGIFRETGKFIAAPLFCTSTATLFGFLITYFGVAQYVKVFASTISNPSVILVLVVGIFFILGMFMDSIPAIIIVLPVIQELASASGIHPVQMGVIVVLTLAFGLVTPPFGICLLMASSIAEIKPLKAVKLTAILAIPSIAVIFLCIFVPDIILALPKFLMPRSM